MKSKKTHLKTSLLYINVLLFFNLYCTAYPSISFDPQGVLDFYEIHSYSWQGTFASVSPFLHSNSDYSADKPILVGEFWEKEGGGMNINQLFSYVYNHGYAGAWSWNVVQNPSQRGGVSTIKDKTSNGRIPINI
ncbi:mannan endo-1,4-beta-mannosidase-like [Aplysia californica]|uniref:Mannan endo-1,4-beta-mannosidase-like n=1 Tax=Aplysia californica TaxID=6500 RepID=A0ABM1VR38_APLCA|nr:mannan endo-1,4-beta-mannosidase-like [Aplysia californica]